MTTRLELMHELASRGDGSLTDYLNEEVDANDTLAAENVIGDASAAANDAIVDVTLTIHGTLGEIVEVLLGLR